MNRDHWTKLHHAFAETLMEVDPIGIKDEPKCVDEYDTYVERIYATVVPFISSGNFDILDFIIADLKWMYGQMSMAPFTPSYYGVMAKALLSDCMRHRKLFRFTLELDREETDLVFTILSDVVPKAETELKLRDKIVDALDHYDLTHE